MLCDVRAGPPKIGRIFQHLLLEGLDVPKKFGGYSMVVITYFELSVQCAADWSRVAKVLFSRSALFIRNARYFTSKLRLSHDRYRKNETTSTH